ncbi:MAG: sulfur carrier protein ThiS [Acidobacteria bacterium]|nr:sulfur carrier protein ThiS [Acidobacteriota bacterium]
MKVVVNGESCEIPEGLSVSQLLAHLGMNVGRIAIERNLDVLPRAQWETSSVREGDRFEIVQFVGGG